MRLSNVFYLIGVPFCQPSLIGSPFFVCFFCLEVNDLKLFGDVSGCYCLGLGMR